MTISSLATPMAMDLLGYTEEEAVQKVGILLSTACVLTAFAFALSGPLAKRFLFKLLSHNLTRMNYHVLFCDLQIYGEKGSFISRSSSIIYRSNRNASVWRTNSFDAE